MNDAAIRRYLEVGRHEDARRLLREALRERPEDPELLLQAAAVEIDDERPDSALRFLAPVLRAAPEDSLARYLLFRIHRARRDARLAEAEILELIRSEPGNAHYLAGYAALCLEHLELDRADRLVRAALRLDASEPLARAAEFLVALARGDRAALDDGLTRVMGESPESRSAAFRLLAVLEERGRYGEAVEVARALLRTAPGDEELVTALVRLAAAAHPSSWPVRPFRGRNGPVFAALAWGIGVGGMTALGALAPGGLVVFVPLWFAFVLYTWVQPPLLAAWIRRRGLR